jgi:hypothetical protein
MTTTETMRTIEQQKFSMQMSMANSFRMFLRNLNSHPAVKTLLDSAKSRDVALTIWKRLLSLAEQRGDFRYLNRFDVPLATYLWVLARTQPDLAQSAAEKTGFIARTWWTEQVSAYLLGQWPQKTATTTSTQFRVTGNINANTSNVTASSEIFLSDTLSGSSLITGAVTSSANPTDTTVVRQDVGDSPSFDTTSPDTAQDVQGIADLNAGAR